MENASKALIIAGAILVAILLIGIGVVLINNTTGVTDATRDQMDSQAVQIKNGSFTQYAGSQKGSSIKSLLNTIASVKASGRSITVYKNTTASDVKTLTGSVKEKNTYTVSFDYDSNGVIDKVYISGTW